MIKLNISPAWLITGEGPMFYAGETEGEWEARVRAMSSGQSAEETQLVRNYRRCAPELQATIRQLLAQIAGSKRN